MSSLQNLISGHIGSLHFQAKGVRRDCASAKVPHADALCQRWLHLFSI